MSRSLSSWKRCLEAGRWPGGSAETSGENGSGFELAVTSQHCFPAIRPTSTRHTFRKAEGPLGSPLHPTCFTFASGDAPEELGPD